MFGGSIGQLAAAVDALDELGDRLSPDELACLFELRSRLEARLCQAVAVFHAAGDGALDGAVSTRAWLLWRARLSGAEAARMIRTGTGLHRVPELADAVAAGRVSIAQADAVIRTVGARLGPFTEHAGTVVDAISGLGVRDTTTVARHWAACHDAHHHREPDGCGCGVDATPEPPAVHLSALGDAWRLDGTFDPADGETIATAIALFAPADPGHATAAQRRAMGLVAACRFALDHRTHPRPARFRPHLVVHTTPGLTVGTTPTGQVIDPATVHTLACDAERSTVVCDRDGVMLHYGRRTRIIPTGLRHAVLTRDQHCRYPGCDRPASWCDVHHVHHWAHGGPTDLANLVLVCGRHHHLLHQPGWHARLHPDATLTITTPTGTTHTSRPPPRTP